jgi:hypothetical protein
MHLYYCLHNIKHKNYANSKWKNKRTEEKDITTLSISENREIDRRSKLSQFLKNILYPAIIKKLC